MYQLNSDYKGSHKSIYLLFIGDIHLGNKSVKPKHLELALKFANQNKNRCRIVLMGDILEAATKTSVGRSVYEESFNTQKQIEESIRIFKPLAEQIDCMVIGNHEERITKDTSIEIVKNFADSIGRPTTYGEFRSLVNFTLGGGLTYTAMCWHGATMGTADTSALNSLSKMRESAVAHIYAMGHTHKLLHFTKRLYLPNPGDRNPKQLEQHFINTGTSMEGGYADQKGLPYNSIGFGVLELFRDEYKIIFHRVSDLVR